MVLLGDYAEKQWCRVSMLSGKAALQDERQAPAWIPHRNGLAATGSYVGDCYCHLPDVSGQAVGTVQTVCVLRVIIPTRLSASPHEPYHIHLTQQQKQKRESNEVCRRGANTG